MPKEIKVRNSLGLKKVIVTSLITITSNFSETLRVTSIDPLEAISTIGDQVINWVLNES